MTGFLYNILLMSASGTVMFILASLLYRQTKKKYARWYYALLTASVALLILPLQAVLSLPKMLTVTVPDSLSVYSDSGTAIAGGGIDISYIIFTIWLIGALSFIAFNAYSYIRTHRTLNEISRLTLDTRVLTSRTKIAEKLKIRRYVEVRKSDMLRSPLLFGIIKPVIILPDIQFSESELDMIFTHELTHYRHRDLFVKLMTIFAASVHWFNPCVCLIKRAINNGCELCCDETVLSVLDLNDKKQYGRLLLSVIENSSGGFAYTTAMSAKQSIKQRLTKIVEFRHMSFPVKVACSMLALSLTVCSVTAFGFEMAVETLPDSVSNVIHSSLRKKTDYDVSEAYMPKATPAPQVQEAAPEAAEPEKVEDYYLPEDNPEPVYTTASYEYVPPVYTPEPDTSASEPQTIQEMGYYKDEENVVTLPETSYFFNPRFTAGEVIRVRSSIIKVTQDCYLYARGINDDDVEYSLHRADGTMLVPYSLLSFSKVPVKAGEEYYILAVCDRTTDANIYVYAQ